MFGPAIGELGCLTHMASVKGRVWTMKISTGGFHQAGIPQKSLVDVMANRKMEDDWG